MGVYGHADWNVTFHSQKAMDSFLAEAKGDFDTIEDAFGEFHEERDFQINGLNVLGWGGGKMYYSEDLLSIIALHADGTADWASDEGTDERWRIRFKGGAYVEHAAVMTYPTDTDLPGALPRLTQDYTPEQREACIDWLASLPLEDLRRRQAVKQNEILRAYEGHPDEVLASLQGESDMLFEARLRMRKVAPYGRST